MRSTVLLVVALLAALGAPVQGYDKEERIQEGIRLHDAGDYDGAIVVYESILKDHPHDSITVYELAFSWTKRGKDLEELTRIIEAELASGIKQHPELPILLGATYDDLGQLANGEAALRRVIDGVPDNPMAHYNLGVNLRLQERWADAAASFQDALRLKADLKSAWFGLGESVEELDQPARVLFARARAVALEPDSERGRAAAATLWDLLFTGVEETNAGDATRATQDITITIPERSGAGGEAPLDSETMERMGMSFAAAGRYAEKWAKKSDAAFFADALDSVVAMFSEMDAVSGDPFWKLTLPWFDEARKKKHIEALGYALRRSAGDKDAAEWVEQHAKRVNAYEEWKQAGESVGQR
jgi:tetratricopeptide (TPR) repeat protein